MTGANIGRLALAAASAAFLAAAVAAQQPQASVSSPPAASQFKNLKILPAAIPRQNLIGVMQMMSSSLGVKCTFCHVGEAGKPETMDFPSDAKPEKQTARMMLEMVRRINEQDFKVEDFSKSKVTCYTCHRGAPHPLTAAPAKGEEAKPAEEHHHG